MGFNAKTVGKRPAAEVRTTLRRAVYLGFAVSCSGLRRCSLCSSNSFNSSTSLLNVLGSFSTWICWHSDFIRSRSSCVIATTPKHIKSRLVLFAIQRQRLVVGNFRPKLSPSVQVSCPQWIAHWRSALSDILPVKFARPWLSALLA
jgi:hypothetical protein